MSRNFRLKKESLKVLHNQETLSTVALTHSRLHEVQKIKIKINKSVAEWLYYQMREKRLT